DYRGCARRGWRALDLNKEGNRGTMGKLLKAGLVTAAMLASINGAFAKDTLVVGEVLEPPGLDPTANAAAGIRQVTYANLYEGLVRIVEDGTVKPLLAESWTVSDDKKTYTFK